MERETNPAIRYVVETIAKERGLTWEEVAAQMAVKCHQLFPWKKEVCYESSHCRRRVTIQDAWREIYPAIETIETNGSAIDEETIALIQKALQRVKWLCLRTLIIQELVFEILFKSVLAWGMPRTKKPSEKTIIRALGWTRKYRIYSASARIAREISWTRRASDLQSTLMALGLSDDPDSATRRQQWRIFKIGHTNGKCSAKKITIICATEEHYAALEAVLENEDKHEWNEGYRDAEKERARLWNVTADCKEESRQNFLIEPTFNAYARSGGSR